MTSPGEQGRSNLCDTAVTSSSTSGLNEVSNFPELPVVPSTDFTRKEGQSRSAASAVNFHNEAFNGGELSELQCNPTEETDLKQRIQNPELSASAAEFIP